MGILDAPLQSVVRSVLSTVGGSCTLKRVVRSYDPLSGDREPVSSTTWTLACSPEYETRQLTVDGAAIQQKEFKLLVSVAGASPAVVPDVNMTVIRGSQEFAIVAVSSVNTGDANAGYILTCRG